MANTERVRMAGIAGAIGGGLWVLLLLVDVAAYQALHASAVAFRAWLAALVFMQALLLVGVVGLARSGATGEGWLGRIGLGIAVLGRTTFVLAEVHNLAKGNDDSPLLPLGALSTGIGMTLVGIAVLRARRWGGWRRPIPLLAGLYPFVAMFPLLAITGQPPLPMIMLWGLPWLLLGLALHAEAGAAGTEQPQPLAVRGRATGGASR